MGNGSDEILALALRAFVERDEKVGFEPSYSLYPVGANRGFAIRAGCVERAIQLGDPEKIETALFLLIRTHRQVYRLNLSKLNRSQNRLKVC